MFDNDNVGNREDRNIVVDETELKGIESTE